MREQLRQPMLNAVRAFEAAARKGSLKAAAAALGVTSSAVSHQVRQLEEEIGKRLFNRRNNAIELTPDGRRLFERVEPALRTIATATEAIRVDSKVVTMNVSDSFAHIWLIPRLPDFQQRHPGIAIDMGTARPVVLDDSVELAITYSTHQGVQGPPGLRSIELLKDFGLPMAVPGLAHDKSGGGRDIRTLPLISGMLDDWDWRDWAAENDVDFAELRMAYRFDTEVAVLAACKAGLGVALLPTDLGPAEIESGQVVPVGAYRQQFYGIYWLTTAPRLRRPAQLFVNWLLKVAPGIRPDHQHGGVVPAVKGVRVRAGSEDDDRTAGRRTAPGVVRSNALTRRGP